MGVLYYMMMGDFSDAYSCLKNITENLRVCGDTKSALFGTTLNQMGLTCIQLNSIREVVDIKRLLSSIVRVLSNLAANYDALGRLDDAIKILEYVVCTREEKLGTGNTEEGDQKRRLAKL
ncbi:hypothetical protein MKW92_044370 [Papaver armeniacum]|nr:hypothetical protein MKW92_044370 [Papaver armeniacum]